MAKETDKHLTGLRVVDGIIRTKGMYYAEREFVPYYHNRCLARHDNYLERDREGNLWHICRVTDTDRALFPSLRGLVSVGVREDQGKILSWTRGWLYHHAAL